MNELLIISSVQSFRDVISSRVQTYPDFISNVYTVPTFLEELTQNDKTIILADGSTLYNGSLDALLVFATKTPMVIVKNNFAPNEVYKLLKSGVSGLTNLEECVRNFLEVIHTIKRREIYLGSNQTSDFYRDIRNTLDLEVLSKRELQVLPLMIKGLTYTEMANQLNITYETMRSHTRNIYKKLNIQSRSDLLKYDIAIG